MNHLTTSVRLAALLAALALTGCANRSLSEHQCSAGDWQSVGYSDGTAGHDQSRILTHQNACGPYNIIPDSAAYRRGWQDGIAQFCQPERGYDRGVTGHSYPTACPAGLRREYRAAYDSGRDLYQARNDVLSLEHEIVRHEQRIEAIRNELVDATTAQIDPTLTTKDRVDLVALSKRLIDERERLQDELPGLHRALDVALERLEGVEQRLAVRG